MSSNHNYTFSEVRSGLFILVSAAILIGLLFYCGTSPFLSDNYVVKAHFNYIAGLKKDSPVQLAGNEIGRVTDLQFVEEKGVSKVEVTLAVYRGVKIRQDAKVFIDIMGFMGEKYIEIQPGSHEAPAITPGTVLQGEDPVAIMEIVHRSLKMMDDFEKISQHMDAMVKQMEGLLETNKPNIQQILDNLTASSANLKDMTSDLKWHPWKLLRKGKEHKE